MANEVSLATLQSNGGRVAKILSDKFHIVLYDPSGLRALMDFRPFNGPTATMSTPKLTRGNVAAAASSEISGGASNSAITTGNFDLTYARYLLRVQPTDLFVMTSVGAGINLDVLLSILTESLDLTLTDMLTALFAGVSGNVGTSGADLTVDNIFDGIYTLNLANNPSALMAVLHNQQVNDLVESIRGESGALQFRTDAQGMLKPPGVGWRGRFLEVDFYQSDSVATANAGADRQGAMFSAGAFGYTLGPVGPILQSQMVNGADIVVSTEEMFVERDRDAGNAMSSFIVNFYPGTVEQEDARAVKVTTAA